MNMNSQGNISHLQEINRHKINPTEKQQPICRN